MSQAYLDEQDVEEGHQTSVYYARVRLAELQGLDGCQDQLQQVLL